MGAWGSGIFEEDHAADVSGHYRERLAAKDADDVAETDTIAKFGQGVEESRSVFWIALALCEHEVGRLSERVSREALDWIESGRSLAIYRDLVDSDEDMTAERAGVLRRAAAKIRSPQPKRKAVRGPRPPPTTNYPWRVGGYFGFRGAVHCATLQVVELMDRARLGRDYARVKHPDFVGEPVFAMLHHPHDSLPAPDVLASLRYRTDWQDPPGLMRIAPMLLRPKQFPAERFVDFGVTREPPPLDAFANHAELPNWYHFESIVGGLNARSDRIIAEGGQNP